MPAATFSSTAIGSTTTRGWLTRYWFFAFVTMYGTWVWLLTGMVAGFGLGWFSFPRVEASFD